LLAAGVLNELKLKYVNWE